MRPSLISVCFPLWKTDAGVAELADARDSKSRGAIRAGSSPATGTRQSLPEVYASGIFRFLRA